MMKKKLLLFPLILCLISLVILFRPAGKITFDRSVSQNRILFQYEIFGCGSLIRKVIDGGEEITAEFINEYPDIGTNEIIFTDNSDEPLKHLNSGDFYTAGLAERYTYVIEGTPVGVTRGASECCEPKPAYNEHVVEFQVDNWYFAHYVPHFLMCNDPWLVLFGFVLLVGSIIWLIISGIKK